MLRRSSLSLLAGAASPAWAGPLASGSAPGIPWLRLFLAFAFCAGLAWVAAALLKQHRQRGLAHPLKDFFAARSAASPRRIAVIETRRASVHADICLVECDGQAYLLALTPAGATVLDRPMPHGAAQ